jgi:hypothetical protein
LVRGAAPDIAGQGITTRDILPPGGVEVSTAALADAIIARL